MGDMALTKRQKEVLEFLAEFIDKNRYSPSYEEIADGLSLSSLATIHKHISSLESKGYLRRAFNQSRSLEIAPRYAAEVEKRRAVETGLAVPLLGKIAAGVPVEAIANPEMLHFQDFLGDSGTYALQVRGESMIEDHICDGDFVLIQKTDSVRDGEIVVAAVDGAVGEQERGVDFRQLCRIERHVNNGADDLDHAAHRVWREISSHEHYPLSASAPPTISASSFVIAA